MFFRNKDSILHSIGLIAITGEDTGWGQRTMQQVTEEVIITNVLLTSYRNNDSSNNCCCIQYFSSFFLIRLGYNWTSRKTNLTNKSIGWCWHSCACLLFCGRRLEYFHWNKCRSMKLLLQRLKNVRRDVHRCWNDKGKECSECSEFIDSALNPPFHSVFCNAGARIGYMSETPIHFC